MSMIRTSNHEELIRSIRNLDSLRPEYFTNLIKISKWLYSISLKGYYITELNHLITIKLEKPFMTKFKLIEKVYDEMKQVGNYSAYILVGDGIDSKEVTYFELKLIFDEIDEWVADTVAEISQDVRFTRPLEILK